MKKLVGSTMKGTVVDKNKIILFETVDHAVKLDVNTDGDTVWLNI